MPYIRQNLKHLNEAGLFIVLDNLASSTAAPPRLHLTLQVERRSHQSAAAAYPGTPLDAHEIHATRIMRTGYRPYYTEALS